MIMERHYEPVIIFSFRSVLACCSLCSRCFAAVSAVTRCCVSPACTASESAKSTRCTCPSSTSQQVASSLFLQGQFGHQPCVYDRLPADDEKKLIDQIFTNAIDSLSDDDKHLPQVENILPLLKRGIGEG
jgi:hypothetical protein